MKLTRHLSITAALTLFASPLFSMEIINVDFDGNPLPASAALYGNASVRAADGNPGGYLSLTDALNGQKSSVIFDSFAGGALTDFMFSADLRVGAGTDRPADGFSFNIARPGDPVLADGLNGWASSPNGNEANQTEEGTTTGLAIGFDEWLSGDQDVVGFSIRIDNLLVQQISIPTLNGTLGDATSLQTGPNGQGLAALGWAELAIMMAIDQTLTITWKGTEIYSDMIALAPITAGQLIIGGRTGGANSHHHLDNISFIGNTGEALIPAPSTLALLVLAGLIMMLLSRGGRQQEA